MKLMNYRYLIYNLIKKDYILKYRNTILGFIWSILEPLSTTIILYIIFSIFAKFQLNHYFLFLFNGLILWQFFSTTLIQGSTILLDNSPIIKKLYFPYFILYLSPLTINFIQYIISVLILLILSFFLIHLTINLYIISVFIVTVMFFIIFLTGLIMIISILNIKYRDISYLTSIILKFWFYLTPILYPADIVPSKYKQLLYLNPIFPFINILQNIFYFQDTTNNIKLLSAAVFYSITLFAIGIFIYIKNYRLFPEEV